MNERIQVLWKQAGGHYNSGNQHTWPEHTITDPEKFAELIVLECAVIVGSMEEPHQDIAKLIKQHFGVEEQVIEPVELHSCPYAEELYGNYDKMCDCDEERTRQCAMDV